jgi:hypothetical protein
MTAFEYDNLPDEMNVDPLPKELFEEASALISGLLMTDEVIAREVKIGHAYDRKGYLEVDTFGGHRNPSYGSTDDDLILQVSLRVEHPSGHRRPSESLKALTTLEQKVREIRLAEARRALEAEIEQAEAEAARAEEVAQKKRERLEALRKA